MNEPTTAVARRWLLPLHLLALFAFLLLPAQLHAQTRVTGRVTAQGTNQPIADVVVGVAGTQVATRTNNDGRFTLTAPAAQGTLVFTRLGFNRREAAYTGTTPVDVTLVAAATKLEEVVVVGYGEKIRATATESVAQVSGEDLRRVPAASPEAALGGRAPGVQVTNESGAPGAPVAVRIRGVGTVGNTQPLFVIDGLPVGRANNSVESPLSTINPDDIESISVLKDASAAAVYGVQAANGVVLIQTRRGRAKTPTVEYNGYYGVQNFPKTYQMLNPQQWYDFGQESFTNYNTQFGYAPTSTDARKFTPWLISNWSTISQQNTDWGDVVTEHNAPISNNFLSVSGNTDRSDYFISGGVFKQAPIITKFDFRRYSGRVNSNIRVTDRVRLSETFTVSHGQTIRGQNNGYNGQLLPNALNLPPFFQYQDVNGLVSGNRYGYTGNAQFANNAGLTFGNEPALNQLVDARDRDLRLLGGGTAELDILPGLTLRSLGSLDMNVVRNTSFVPPVSQAEIGLDRADNDEETRTDNLSLLWSNTLNFNRQFGRHNVNAVAGTEIQKGRYTGSTFSTTGLITTADAYRQIPTAGSSLFNPPASWAGENAFLSYLGRVSYNFADKYLLTASLRRDGSSNFAPENRWGTFPAFSAGWRLTQEPWFKVPALSEFKIRGSWGRLGNSDVPRSFPHINQVATTPDYGLNGSTVVKAPALTGLVNRNLIWETSESIDFGFESGWLDNRLTFNANYFKRDTKDFLLNVPIPATSGLSFGSTDGFGASAAVNSGLVRNKGMEFESGYEFTAPFGVDIRLNGNLTTLKNELVSLRPGIEEYSSGGGYRTAVGQPIDYFYGYQTCGLYRDAAAAAAAPVDKTIGSNKTQAGDLCFVDVNGDKVIDAKDRTYLGKTIPDFYYGFQVNSNWKQFDVSLFFNGVGGIQKYNAVRSRLGSMGGGGGNKLVSVLNHWTPENPDAANPRNVAGDPSGNGRFSDFWVEDANYFRLKNLQLGYNLPAGKFGLKNATRVYVAGTNLWTATPYSGLDPEFTTSVDFSRSRNDQQQQSGTDNGFIPQPRMWQFGLRTTF
jgi:TonB-dependent starch-binding outer membrane protein SusC